MNDISTLRQQITNLKDDMDKSLITIKLKYNELFGGDSYRGRGNAVLLKNLAKLSSGGGVLIENKNLVTDTIGGLNEIFENDIMIMQSMQDILLKFEPVLDNQEKIIKDYITNEANYKKIIKDFVEYTQKLEKEKKQLEKEKSEWYEAKRDESK